MERNKQTKIISIIALIVAVTGLTLGFAAFSNTLVISSNATVKPSSSDFSVLFSSSGSTQEANDIIPTAVTGVAASAATLNGTTISGIKVNFTKTGQEAYYDFYIHNAGLFDAYLKGIVYANATGTYSFAKCTIPTGSGATQALVDAACNNMHVHVFINRETDFEILASSTLTNLTNKKLAKGAYIPIRVVVEYGGQAPVDGQVEVTFGDISLLYSSTDIEYS